MTNPTTPTVVLDWSGRDDGLPATVGVQPAPCHICGRPALLRHPLTGKPCHKVCAERAARWAATAGGAGR
jgi:hypothetical protein